MTPLSKFKAGDVVRWQILLDGKPLPTMESYATRELAEKAIMQQCRCNASWLGMDQRDCPLHLTGKGRLTVAERGPVKVEFGEPKP